MVLKTSNTLSLRDGRCLGYAEHGEEDGFPVFLLHGNPGSRLCWGYFPDCPFLKGVRLIAPDRPGYGLSDFKKNALESWPEDIRELAAHLGIEKFSILGVSGGGPYALACAWKIPDQLSAVGLAASVGPNTPEAVQGVIRSVRILWKLANPMFWLVKLQMRLMAAIATRKPEKMMKQLRDLELSESDKKIFDRPEIQRLFIEDFPEAYRQKGIGSAYDASIPGSWPIPLNEIQKEVHIWSAEQDQLVGNMGRYLASQLIHSKINVIPYRGHLWVLENMSQMLADLIPVESSGFGIPPHHLKSVN